MECPVHTVCPCSQQMSGPCYGSDTVLCAGDLALQQNQQKSLPSWPLHSAEGDGLKKEIKRVECEMMIWLEGG